MLDEILQNLGRLDETQEAWVRAKLKKLTRYKNLEPYIDWFEVGYYNSTRLILAMKTGKSPIPLPKNQLKSNKSSFGRLCTRLRKQVDDQVKDLRRPGLHVDHVYPFKNIVLDWLAENNLTVSKVRVYHYPSFREYHLKHATYQYLTPEENIRKGARLDYESTEN